MEHERENMYFQQLSKEAENFQFFKAYVIFNMAMCLGTFCGVFFVMYYLWVSKGQRHFWGALCRKGRKDKTGEMQQKSILPAAGTVLNEAANRVKQVGSGIKKRKKLRGSTVY